MNSDSGCVFVFECFSTSKAFQPIHCGVLGKTGIGRIVPDEVLAVDPQGRALMIAAAEKQKIGFARS